MLRTVIVSLAVCLALAGTAGAAELRIGVVDMPAVGAQCDANQASRTKYENQFKTETDQLSKQKNDFDKKARDFEAQRGSLDQKTFEQRVANLRKEAQQIADKEMATQQRIGAIQNAINQELADLAVAAAAEVAKDKDLDLIMTQNTVLYAKPEHNVSDDLLAAMNRIWKAQGSKVPGASADVAPAAPAAPSGKGGKR